MKAYFTIISDCFHEAFVSRILWIVLGLITLFLIALAPISVEERLAINIRVNEVFDAEAFLKQVAREGAANADTPGSFLWGMIEETDQTKLTEAIDDNKEDGRGRAIRGALSNLLDLANDVEDPKTIYSDTAFANVKLPDEAQELWDKRDAGLNEEEGRRLNRYLIGSAFPRSIYLRNAAETHLSYFIWFKDLDALPLAKEDILEGSLTAVTTFLLGTLGVMIAILITASMIPQTFDKGAIDLLLSKPLNRPFLFLAKYFGGCAFIAINAAYLVGGLCLLSGLRWDFWQPRMLLGIPIFLFLFGIYYSISAIAGVIWRNSVVCVFLTVAFWAMCFTVGTSRTVIQEVFMAQAQASRILPLDSAPIVKAEANVIVRWDEENEEDPWVPFEDVSDSAGIPPQMSQVNGPAYDSKNDRVIALRSRAQGPGRRGFGGNSAGTVVGGPASEWTFEDGPELKDRPSAIVVDQEGGISVIGRRGVQRLIEDEEGNETYQNIGPSIGMVNPTSVSLDPGTRRLAVWDGEKISLYSVGDDGTYELDHERELKSMGIGLVTLRGDTVVIATEAGSLLTFSATDLADKNTFELYSDSPPRFIDSSSDGAWTAIVYHDNRMRLANHIKGSWNEPRIAERKSVFAVAFADDGNLWVNGKYRRITVYDPATLDVVKKYWPKMKTFEKVVRYGIEPLYTVFPKPGELSSVISYLMTGEESVSADPNDLSVRRVKLNIRGTVWSNLAFLTVMLGFGCIYIQRKDF